MDARMVPTDCVAFRRIGVRLGRSTPGGTSRIPPVPPSRRASALRPGAGPTATRQKNRGPDVPRHPAPCSPGPCLASPCSSSSPRVALAAPGAVIDNAGTVPTARVKKTSRARRSGCVRCPSGPRQRLGRSRSGFARQTTRPASPSLIREPTAVAALHAHPDRHRSLRFDAVGMVTRQIGNRTRMRAQ